MNYRLMAVNFLLVLSIGVPTLANAEIYQWTDKQGKTHFSDRPVSGSVPVDVDLKDAGGKDEPAPSRKYQPIFNNQPEQSRKIVIMNPLFKLARPQQQVAELRFGRNCVSPQMFSHKKLTERKKNPYGKPELLVQSLNQVFRRNNYAAYTADAEWVEKKAQNYHALILVPEITSIDINACASGVKAMDAVSSRRFERYRYDRIKIKLSVSWQLSESLQLPAIFSTTTEVYVDAWNKDMQVRKISDATEKALQASAEAMLSKQDFVELLRSTDEVKILPENITSGDLSFSGLLNKVSGGYLQASKLSNALSLLASIKIEVVQYYQMKGEMPANIADITFVADPDLLRSHNISSLEVHSDGSIFAYLNEEFGDNGVLSLVPQVYAENNIITWQCLSNLDENVLQRVNCKKM